MRQALNQISSSGSLKDKVIDAIVRPPRRHYKPEAIPIKLDAGDDKIYLRHPLNFTNERDQRIVGSVYVREGQDLTAGGPCVIYMHGNASSQMEGQFLVPNFCPLGVAVYCFDFAGCGESDGDYISLGYYEKRDVEYLMGFLHSTFNLGPFALWGRSMGAATAVLARSPLLKCIVVDSTFCSINSACSAIAKQQNIPSVLVPSALWFLKHIVYDKVGFDMSKVSPLEVAKTEGAVPAIFGHATDDEFIPIDQGRKVFMAYSNPDKKFIHLFGGHNRRRKEDWLTECMKFILKNFGINSDDFKLSYFKKFHSQEDSLYDQSPDEEDHRHFESYQDMMKNIK